MENYDQISALQLIKNTLFVLSNSGLLSLCILVYISEPKVNSVCKLNGFVIRAFV